MSQCAFGRQLSDDDQALLRQVRIVVREVHSNAPSAHTAQVVPLQPAGQAVSVSQCRSGLQRCTPGPAQRSAPGRHSLHSPRLQPPRHNVGPPHSPFTPHVRWLLKSLHSRVPTLQVAQ
jgi:hypothetical protein